MNLKNSKQLILDNLQKEKSCLKNLVAKLEKQKEAIEGKDEEQIFKIIEEKNVLIEVFQKLERGVETQVQLLSHEAIQGVAQEADALKASLEELLETIVRMEEECEKEIGLKMQEVEKRIFGLQKGKKIGKGYSGFLKNRPLISKKV